MRLEKCSAETIYKLSKALGVSMEALIESILESVQALNLSRLNHIPLCNRYDDLRTCKLQKIIYPASVQIAAVMRNETIKNKH